MVAEMSPPMTSRPSSIEIGPEGSVWARAAAAHTTNSHVSGATERRAIMLLVPNYSVRSRRPADLQRAPLEVGERRVRIGRNQRDRFEPAAALSPPVSDLGPQPAVETRDPRPIVGACRAERVERLEPVNRPSAFRNRFNGIRDGADVIMACSRTNRDKQGRQTGIAGLKYNEHKRSGVYHLRAVYRD